MAAHELDLAAFRAAGLRISFHSALSVGRLGTVRLRCRALAFAYFVERRLSERGLWRPRRAPLELIVSPHAQARPSTEVAVVQAEFSGEETDEELIAAITTAFSAPFQQCVPGARLDVLADEFLEAGCTFTTRTSRLTDRGSAAQLAFHLGMRAFEASLEVQSKAGTKRHSTMASGPDADFWSLFGKLSLSPRRVVLRAVPSASFVRDTGKRRHVFRTGPGSAARRYVVDLATDGTQRLTQQWELTGRGGKPVPGSGLLAKNATAAGPGLVDV